MIIPSYKGGNQDTEQLSHLSELTQLVSGRAGIQTLADRAVSKIGGLRPDSDSLKAEAIFY